MLKVAIQNLGSPLVVPATVRFRLAAEVW